MPTNEVNSIRYLMREMDPSEEIEFEREMMRDENLLIEVESLRITFNRLGKLPEVSVPEGVLNNVLINAAVTTANRKSAFWLISNKVHKTAAAAAVLFIALFAGYLVTGGESGIVDEVTPIPQEVLPVKSSQVTKVPATPIKAVKIQPWIDQNDIISIGDRVNSEILKKLDQDYTNSYNKLILVRQTRENITPNTEILYTNSPVEDN